MESPRLLTRTCSAPKSLMIRSMARSTSSDFVTSATRGTTRRPVALAMTDALDELLRRPLAPLRPQPLVRRNHVRAVFHVQAIGVRPVLVHAAPRVRPVVVDLAAQEMAPNAPHVLVLAKALHVLVTHEHV